MERDWDLVRELLLSVAENDSFDFSLYGGSLSDLALHNEWRRKIYHVGLLLDEGLIKGISKTHDEPNPRYQGRPQLTWEGNDFLDAIRDESVWAKTKDKANTVASGLTFALIKELATQFLKENLGLS